MAAFAKHTSRSPPLHSPGSMDSGSGRSSMERKTSTSSSRSTQPTIPISPRLSPKVQLVPYARTASFDISLSETERELLDKASTNFDALDLSSKDFDFEDIFTYDKPQKKLTKGVVEVSRPTRDYRDWSSFSFSHYSAAMSARQKVNKAKSGIGELYLKNKSDAQKS
ncbi:uncharacterized protein Z519_03496 [Cladophialophora bantiana CBS 173.52]|uniref:Uncharacterized protein n=1 Tax=Cladophialophora bantiana (strain ATCC 10958 / CBS 173.52 / CDC B-1940 / NIH 8579) TaxID=1442370 RepID=A0A0D2GDG1_CLAB1|nr:uncharacterized protein Z519_03496 [Cladophialophora bantiana CBS 173.52]KIW96427.1 hypothetical protein Z519_03496 [Cladophialophora bantiana CBS 173.52]